MPDEPLVMKHEQLEALQSHLVPEERLHAVLDCYGVPTSFVGITDCRLLLVTKDKTVLSVPYSRMSSIAYNPGGLMSNPKIKIYLPEEKKLELGFEGEERVFLAYRMICAGVLGKAAPRSGPGVSS